MDLYHSSPVPLAARSKAWVCGRPPAEIVNSNPGGEIEREFFFDVEYIYGFFMLGGL